MTAGIDAIFTPDRVISELPRYAKTLARIGAPPPRVILAMRTEMRARPLVQALEHANLQVSYCGELAHRPRAALP